MRALRKAHGLLLSGSNATALIYVICVILIYLILASLYNSWFTPLAVLLSVPFGLMGSFGTVYLIALFGLLGIKCIWV